MRMRESVLLLALCLAAGGALAQQKATDLGQREYRGKCASCHGLDGKGNGPNRLYLTRAPTDLTLLAKGNGGVLPVGRMFEVIEGSRDVAAHGSRDMPTWGAEYRWRAAEYYGDMPYDPDAFVNARILALIEYLNRLQGK